MKYLLGLFLGAMTFFSACKLDGTAEESFSNCSQTGSFALDYKKKWDLSSAQLDAISGSMFNIDPTDCLDTLCAFAQLDFTDTSYIFDYFLPVKIDENNYDTLQKSEVGTYEIDYCFFLDSTNPIPERWEGELTFQPDRSDLYSTRVFKTPGGPLQIQRIVIAQGELKLILQ